MRYVPIAKLSTGMAVGQDIFDGEGRLILAKHMILNHDYIKGLTELKFPGIYIDDEFTEDIRVEQILRPEVKQEALRMVHDLFMADVKEPTAQEELQRVVMGIITDVMNNGDVMCNMLDIKTYDDYTYFHCVNVAVLSAMIGTGYCLSEEDMKILTMAAILHDVGKRFVDIDVLNAKRRLTEEEHRIIVQHPKLGYEFLKDHYDFSSYVYSSVLQHHEWYNGEGYPLRRSGDDIPVYARIIKLADVYDALTSNRPYHTACSPSEAVEYLMGSAGVEFDPDMVNIFLQKIAVYPIGCEVRLSDGRTAVVVENYKEFVLRPRVKIIPSGEVIDLKEDAEARNITILDLLI